MLLPQAQAGLLTKTQAQVAAAGLEWLYDDPKNSAEAKERERVGHVGVECTPWAVIFLLARGMLGKQDAFPNCCGSHLHIRLIPAGTLTVDVHCLHSFQEAFLLGKPLPNTAPKVDESLEQRVAESATSRFYSTIIIFI